MTEHDDDHLPWCHLLAQLRHHSPAYLEGTREALVAIRDAIDMALRTGMNSSAQLFASDGEGYGLEIAIRNYDYLCEGVMPYIDPSCVGIGADMMEHEEIMNRRLNEQIAWHVYYQTRRSA